MQTGRPDPSENETPVVSIRGRLEFAASDSKGANTGLVIAMIAGFAAIGFSLALLGELPDGVQAFLVVAAVLASVLFLVGFLGWRYGKDELAVFPDRIVLRPYAGSGSGPAFVVRHEDLEQLAVDKSWIRLRQKNGRRLSFKSTRLQVGDFFDVLSEKVEDVNPGCVVKDR